MVRSIKDYKLWVEFVCLETGSTSRKDDLTSCKPGSGSLILRGCVAASGTGHIMPIEGRMDSTKSAIHKANVSYSSQQKLIRG